jgi:class 3 adenylate cyclase
MCSGITGGGFVDHQAPARLMIADVAPAGWQDLEAHERFAVCGLIFGPSVPAADALVPQPEARAAFRAILFTDMVDSTEMTGRLGDAGAVEVVRAHDALIRRALRVWGGREVKHTGDGFMASFPAVDAALACAAAIQRALARHNRRAAEPIHVRIGLHAGDVILDGPDLFGSAVQLAARLCRAAGADCILVSDAVRLACGTAAFTDLGPRAFKGFLRPTRVFALGRPCPDVAGSVPDRHHQRRAT